MSRVDSEDSRNAEPRDRGWDGRSSPPGWWPASRLLTDRYASRILAATWDRTVTVRQLRRELGIPASACYRRLRVLERLGLVVRLPGPRARNGRQRGFYRSTVRSAAIVLERGRLKARLLLRGTGEKPVPESPSGKRSLHRSPD